IIKSADVFKSEFLRGTLNKRPLFGRGIQRGDSDIPSCRCDGAGRESRSGSHAAKRRPRRARRWGCRAVNTVLLREPRGAGVSGDRGKVDFFFALSETI